ncbi:MAG: hypothetical protein F7C38_00875 [Desulfurococcales archaeon]|nr:hypothetical protein [Desulfurococcales archaeon]
MSSIKDFEEALKIVEKHLDFARLVYRSLPFVFWAGVIPLLYIVTSFVPGVGKQTALGLGIGAGLALWFLLEESTAYRVLERLDAVLGREVRSPTLYTVSQMASWIIGAVIAYASLRLGLPEPAWPLVFFGTGMGLLMAVDKVFRGGYDKEMAVACVLPLLSVFIMSRSPLPGEDFAVMIASSSLALTGLLYLRRAFRG